jgi:hypothetical protein
VTIPVGCGNATCDNATGTVPMTMPPAALLPVAKLLAQ